VNLVSGNRSAVSAAIEIKNGDLSGEMNIHPTVSLVLEHDFHCLVQLEAAEGFRR
jgi:hypothetical protein